MAKLSTTILYIPLVSTTLEMFNCVDTWQLTGWECFTGMHMLAVVVAGVVTGTLCFSIFSFIGTVPTRIPACCALTDVGVDVSLPPY